MPVSALVLTLSPDPEEREHALATLCQLPYLTLGEVVGAAHLPVVLESDSLSEGEDRFRHLTTIAGVVFADLAMVDFEDVEEFEELPRRNRGRRQE